MEREKNRGEGRVGRRFDERGRGGMRRGSEGGLGLGLKGWRGVTRGKGVGVDLGFGQ